MRIGVNTRLLLPGTLEGIGRFTFEVLQRMVKANSQDDFYFYFDRPFDDRYIFTKNVHPIVLSPQARTPMQWYWWFEKSLPKAMEEDKIEVFFSPELYASLKTKIPTLLIAHDIAYFHYPQHFRWYHLLYLKHFTPLFLRKAVRIGCVSHTTKEDLRDSFGIPQENLFVAENGPTPGFAPLSDSKKLEVQNTLTKGHPYFLYLGSIHPRKNTTRTVRAFELFRDDNPQSNHKLVLVGRMAWKTCKSLSAISKNKYRKDIIHLGQREDASSILGAADALLYVSLFEGFGIPILEGFAAHTPVITSNVGSMKEVAGDAALLVNPLKTKSIAFNITKIYKDPLLRSKLIEKGKERLAEYSWERTSEVIYKELTNFMKK
jgi:glycosyltransferase involved in cell wall biosynthesis